MAGIGRLDGDSADVLEGIVISNQNKSAKKIADIAYTELSEQLEESAITDNELLSYIRDIQRIYRI